MVIVINIVLHHAPHMGSIQNEQFVETFFTDASHPAFRISVGIGSPNGCANDLDVFGMLFDVAYSLDNPNSPFPWREIRGGALVGTGMFGRSNLQAGGAGQVCFMATGNLGAGWQWGEQNCALFFPESVLDSRQGGFPPAGSRGQVYTQAFELWTARFSGARYIVGPTRLVYYGTPPPELTLTLDVDPALAPSIPRTDDGAYNFTVGDQIPLLAEVSVDGTTDITDPVRVELTVPRGLRPQGMTIQGEDQTFLNALFTLLITLLDLISPDLSGLVNDILGIDVTPDTVTFTYDYEGGLIVGGQPFPITLDVVGQVPGTFTVTGQVYVLSATVLPMAAFAEPAAGLQQVTPTPTPTQASVNLQVVEPTCTITIASDRDVFGYATALEALLGSEVSPQNLRGFTDVVVDLRSIVNGNVVRARLRLNDGTFSPPFWFFSANENVVNPTEGDCNQLSVEVDDGSNYAIRIVSDASGANGSGTRDWTAFEQREIILGVDEIARAFATISTVQPTTPVEAFNRVYQSVPSSYPEYVLLVRANSTIDSLWRSPETSNEGNNLTIPDVTVNFEFGGESFTGVYADINVGNCKAYEAQQVSVSDPTTIPRTTVTVNMPSAVVCNGVLLNNIPNTAQPLSPVTGEASQHTIVHEFGHIFDYLTSTGLGIVTDTMDGGGGTGVIGSGSFVLGGCDSITTDDRPSTVMGVIGGEWRRGGRGWGSAQPFSTFLQSLERLVPFEAAADMFLNWVYRTNRNGVTAIDDYSTDRETAPSTGCVPLVDQIQNGQILETWAEGGFYNRAPDDNEDITSADFDWALSGDIRHALMNDILNGIFNTEGW